VNKTREIIHVEQKCQTRVRQEVHVYKLLFVRIGIGTRTILGRREEKISKREVRVEACGNMAKEWNQCKT